ncbi:hypothetical protein AVEN_33096-1 [Araneus ventricosus]|uniref:Uncharacterized protein n=1 Tax=Araneus ventricosus TaxID=182803 RepID=A0A4Y2CTQ5_ARAVE|nr:hypothetical protein AVEN_33096-1 [Araneus ventricosus]
MLPVRSYSVRMKRRNREAAASFRRSQVRRKAPTTATTTTATTRGAHAPARRTVSAGSTLPSEAKAVRSPSTKSVSSEPGASTSKDFKIETVPEEEQEDKEEAGDEKEDKEDVSKDEKDKDKEGDEGKEKDEAKDEEKVSASSDKSHVKFQEPEEDDEKPDDTK